MNGSKAVDIILKTALDPPTDSYFLTDIIEKKVFIPLIPGRGKKVAIRGDRRNKTSHGIN